MNVIFGNVLPKNPRVAGLPKLTLVGRGEVAIRPVEPGQSCRHREKNTDNGFSKSPMPTQKLFIHAEPGLSDRRSRRLSAGASEPAGG